jgi:hypothetical protein
VPISQAFTLAAKLRELYRDNHNTITRSFEIQFKRFKYACKNIIKKQEIQTERETDLKLSAKLLAAGEIFTNIKHFELPPKEFCNKNVNLESRYGTC